MPARINPRFCFTLFVLAVLVFALWSMMDFPTAGARRFPATFAGIGLFLAALQLLLDWRRGYSAAQPAAILDLQADGSIPHRVSAVRALKAFSWMFAFVGVTLLFSLYISLWIFVPAYLLVEAKSSWRGALAATILLALTIFGILSYGMNISVPHGLFFRGYFG